MPNNVALVMSLRTGIRGRSYRGRVYVGGIPESNALGNNALAAYRDALVDRYDDLLIFAVGIGIPDAQLVVLSYFANGVVRASPVATPVSSVTADTRFDTMRRRMS